MSRSLRLGTRGSLLATTQSRWVADQILRAHPDLSLEIVVIKTAGDLNQQVPASEVGTKGIFVKEIEDSLLSGAIDLAVHSMKDMPSELPEGLAILAVPEREDPRDALLMRVGGGLTDLPQGASVGTGSIRRAAQLLVIRPDLRFMPIRGNIDTRIRKMESGEVDALILAYAGLNRLGLSGHITEALAVDICVPAAGQGALAVETRADDADTNALLGALNHSDTQDAVAAERGFLAALGGGCSIPAGVLAVAVGPNVSLVGLLAAPDGSETIRLSHQGARSEASTIGRELALRILAAGGDRWMKG